jgi:periodic tryptophan protein 1
MNAKKKNLFCKSYVQRPTMSSLISAVAWVRRGISAQNPSKYVLDDKELERVSALARIELEDARVELERAHEAAKSMGRGAEGNEADDAEVDGDEDNWVESVLLFCFVL